MFSWWQKINSKILLKITVLVVIEIILIVGSFSILVYFQSQQSSLGNSINIAGKNRYLTANLLLQTEKYLYGLASSSPTVTSDASQLKDAMSSLESNIMTLKQGGMISGVNLKPLPPNLLPLWNSVDNRLNIYKTYLTNKLLALPSEARTVIMDTTTKTTTTDQSLVRKEIEPMASSLIESSDRLVTLLGQQTDKNTQNLMLLQILFAILIIGILVLILYLVARILRPIVDLTQATSKVKNGNLDVSIKQKGCDELSILSQSFNSMVQSIKNYITQQNQLTSELQKLNEQLERKDQLKDEFINIAAHELRAPIQPIVGLSDILRLRRLRTNRASSIGAETKRSSDEEQFLETIVRNAKRLQALSENILDITKIESRTLKLKKEKFNINEKIKNVIEDIKSKDDEIAIIFDEQKEDPIIVEADSIRIYQVISNLLNNALKSSKICIDTGDNYSTDYDISSTITALTTIKKFSSIYKNGNNTGKDSLSNNHNDEVIVSIKDRGTGIDPDIQDKLFSKFATKSDTGSGLGLYISKGIVEAHGGRIWAENNSDGEKGATFSFSLPI
ncbi:MAG TPA: ATP-binding protein [Candidatus Nitrosocosmicus sp.]|nr:ATP-binding protein [Candidatus Nitrosocosmicus sp.]